MATSLRNLLGKSITKDVTFMGEPLSIRKLTVRQVEEIQAFTKEMESNSEAEVFANLKKIIDEGAPAFVELSLDEFKGFPLEELQGLSKAITEFSGLRAPDENKGNA